MTSFNPAGGKTNGSATSAWDDVLAAEFAKYGRTPDAAASGYWSGNQNIDALRGALAADAAKAAGGNTTKTPKTYGLSDISGKYNGAGQVMDQSGADFWQSYLNQHGWDQTNSAMDNAFIYDKAKTVAPGGTGTQQPTNDFASILEKMMGTFGQQQQGYQNSIATLMKSWADMAKPQTPATGTTATSPYVTGNGVMGTTDGIGQASAVFNPMGQNGLNFGWTANNPFGATF